MKRIASTANFEIDDKEVIKDEVTENAIEKYADIIDPPIKNQSIAIPDNSGSDNSIKERIVQKVDNVRKEVDVVLAGINEEESEEVNPEDLKELIDRDRDYFMNIINIERCQKKPRKDIAKYEDIVDNIWFMYDDLYESRDKDFDWQVINDKEEIKNILDTYMDKYFNIDDKDSWFNGVRDLTSELGYCAAC